MASLSGQQPPKKVAIIGGGMGALTAAYFLTDPAAVQPHELVPLAHPHWLEPPILFSSVQVRVWGVLETRARLLNQIQLALKECVSYRIVLEILNSPLILVTQVIACVCTN